MSGSGLTSSCHHGYLQTVIWSRLLRKFPVDFDWIDGHQMPLAVSVAYIYESQRGLHLTDSNLQVS